MIAPLGLDEAKDGEAGTTLAPRPPALRVLERPAATGASAAASIPAHPGGWARRMGSNLTWNVVSELSARGASLWLAFWCARALPVSEFGRFGFAMAIVQYVWLLGDAAANGGFATREVARVHASDAPLAARLAGRFLAVRVRAALALAVIVPLAAWWLPGPLETRVAVAGASLFFLAYASFADFALRAVEDFRGLALANATGAAALVAGTLVLLPRHPSAATAAAIWGSSFFASAVVAMVRLRARRAIASPERHAPGSPWSRSLLFSLGAVAGIGCAQSPALFMGALGSPYENGLFTAAYRLVVLMIGVFSMLWWPLFPVLARSRPGHPDYRDALVTVSRVALLVGLPPLFAFLVYGPDMLTLAFGARYVGGVTALRVAALAIPAYSLSGLFEQACLAAGGEATRVRVNVSALVLMTLVCVTLVPRWGAVGAAAALPAGFAFSALVYGVALRSELPRAAMARHAAPALPLALALGAAWFAAHAAHVSAVIALPAGAILYVAAVLALRMLPAELLDRRKPA